MLGSAEAISFSLQTGKPSAQIWSQSEMTKWRVADGPLVKHITPGLFSEVTQVPTVKVMNSSLV